MGEAHSSAPRRASAECPIACRRNQEKNADETRGRGSLSRWPYLGWGQPVEGAAARERPALPCSPPRSLSPWLPREREAGVRGNWMLPSANADAPTSLSNLLLLGLHGIGEHSQSTNHRKSRSSGADVCPRFSGCGARAQGHGPRSPLPSIAPAPRRSAESWSRAHEPRQATPGLARLVNGEATAHSAGRWQLDRRLWERWATALRVYRARNPTTLAAAHRAPLFERSPRPPVLQYPPASAESPASGEWQPIRRLFSGA